MSKPVKVKDAPGLVWRQHKDSWEARWRCRADLAVRGFTPKNVRLWKGQEPNEQEWNWIADRCRTLQAEMLVWGRGGVPQIAPTFDGTLRSLADLYQTDADSTFRKLRYRSRMGYAAIIRTILASYGDEQLSDLKARTFLRWHETWAAGGHVPMAHTLIGMVRTLVNFGATILEDAECERLSGVLGKMRFPQGKPRTERLTAEQAIAIRAKAHEMGRPSLALAQAFQFECILRQRDVIGEWVPMSEPGVSDVTAGGFKWLRGIRWEEISDTLVLRHVTSKRQKEIEVDLKLAPMVMEELDKQGRKASGPVIVSEWDQLPWSAAEFRRWWRMVADACGIPKSVKNMDSRAGAISEATDAGAELEHVRHAATHSDISMTQRYSRAGAEKTAKVMQIRAAARERKGNTGGENVS